METVEIAALAPGDMLRSDGQDRRHVRLLAETLDELPPILVHRATMRVMDGMHRVSAARLRGREHIAARFLDGSAADAFVASVEANVAHGLPLTRRDRNHAAARIVATHPYWSNRAIAAKVGLSDKTVAAIRRRSGAGFPQAPRGIGRDGRVWAASAEDGRLRAAEHLVRRPDATVRELAAAGEIALSTARDVRRRVVSGEDPVPARRGSVAVPDPRRGGSTQQAAGLDVRDAAEVVADVVTRLRNDPSLRFTDVGRLVLRLLDVHSMDNDDWVRLIDLLPPHCAPTVAEAADQCAVLWRNVADHLKRRATGR
ncbi:ParB N-terminal domain-containing protein [Actinosynnema sp. NPDC050801]|uniref:ParB N-terminal domain-containing protein n=1 Tax=unclassified Actinosynnema TaxID=2637065 RepID=UPI0033FC688D